MEGKKSMKGKQTAQANFRTQNVILSFHMNKLKGFIKQTCYWILPPVRIMKVTNTTFHFKKFINSIIYSSVEKILIKKCSLSFPNCNMENSSFSTKNVNALELRSTEGRTSSNYTLSWKLHSFDIGIWHFGNLWFSGLVGFKALQIPHFPSLSQRKESSTLMT